ncbi:MAG: energy-coupling factor transporter transmembrane protein EcfT [Candidatus Caldarchaeum sp.]|nr:energy-coupling factor transporter transmembrane protein EcfT [Candidatus Caldarchaeum sp.]
MSVLEGLRFRPGNTFVHRLDPRVKLLTSVMILTTAVVHIDIILVGLLLLVEAAVIIAARVHRLWLRTVRGAVPLALIVFIISFISQYSREPSILVSTGFALAYSFRLVVFLSSFSLFFLTTTPDEMALTLQKMKLPYEYTFAFVSAIRFTPVMAEELRNVMDAQRARGLELDKGPFLRRIRNLIPILVPLLVNVIRRSYELAEAMEVKCFGASKKRTSLRVLRLTRADVLFLCCAALLFVAAVAVKVLGLEPVRLYPILGRYFPV